MLILVVDNMVRQENIGPASSVTSTIPASTVIVTQNNQPEPLCSELINLDISNTLQKGKNLANSNRRDYGRRQPGKEGKGSLDDLQTTKIGHSDSDDTILPSQRADTATRSLSGHIQSQPQSLQQFPAVQGVPEPCRSVKKLHEFLPDCEKILGPSQYLQSSQWMASIDGEEKNDALDTRMEEKQPSTTQESAKNSTSGQQQQFQPEKAATSSKQGQRKGTSHQTLQPGLQDAMENVFQMARTMMAFQKKEEDRLKYQK
ncbi:hypothetical protein O181_066550 [Austropuccinia psidii MF-1]|uniref:Uncharacterized protein n=1 Tax=Austropuccinia psidii MF-1 TaxID=1389203 RepID=A0A9Q3EXA1_9BASI|nr:hypothetical protein [Austropuccinia psidii MF-1]